LEKNHHKNKTLETVGTQEATQALLDKTHYLRQDEHPFHRQGSYESRPPTDANSPFRFWSKIVRQFSARHSMTASMPFDI
jgi:hypothetical protein